MLVVFEPCSIIKTIVCLNNLKTDLYIFFSNLGDKSFGLQTGVDKWILNVINFYITYMF